MPRLMLIDKSSAGGGSSPLGAVDLIELDAEKMRRRVVKGSVMWTEDPSLQDSRVRWTISLRLVVLHHHSLLN